jgi:hypothetical protein
MSSTIGVQNIAHTNGTVAATVDSGGNIAMASGKTFSATGAVLQLYTDVNSTRSVTVQTYAWNNIFTGTFNKLASTSKLVINSNVSGWGIYSGESSQRMLVGTSTSNTITSTYENTAYVNFISGIYVISGNTQTGSLTWTLQWYSPTVAVVNPNSTDHASLIDQTSSVITITEIGG